MPSDFEFDLEDYDFEVSVNVKVADYEAERPPPPCSNPDSPRFSDPGDPAEYNLELFFRVYKDGKEKLVPVPAEMYHLWDNDLLHERICKEGGEAEYDNYVAAMEHKADDREDR